MVGRQMNWIRSLASFTVAGLALDLGAVKFTASHRATKLRHNAT
jgi:hypothetical protein